MLTKSNMFVQLSGKLSPPQQCSVACGIEFCDMRKGLNNAIGGDVADGVVWPNYSPVFSLYSSALQQIMVSVTPC